MATQTQVLQAAVSSDDFHVGPAVILLQSASSYSITADDGTGFPRYIEDVISVTVGSAMSANGWSYLGYTENINPSRNRTVVQHDSDQEARVETVHDTWENTITVTSLEMTLANLQTFWGGKDGDPAAVAGAPNAQQWVRIGNPTSLTNRRVAIVHIDKDGKAWAFVYRKCDIRPTGGPTFSRTGRVELPLEFTCKPDTRVSDVDSRILTVFKTDSSIE